jgi:hypothetical protein
MLLRRVGVEEFALLTKDVESMLATVRGGWR